MKSVAVIGSSGAIGKAFIANYLENEAIKNIISFSRSPPSDLNERVKHYSIDIEDEASIKEASANLNGLVLDEVIIASGLLHTEDFGPEKSIKDLKAENILKVFKVNTVGPAIIGKYFLPLLNKNTKSIMAFLSARVGSISENKSGGWYSYRASKSALNQIIKNFSIEIKRSNPNAIIIGLQPGTVESNLSEPFKKNVKEGNLFTAEYSVGMLKEVIDSSVALDSGKLIGWDGQEINP
ncbi:MAG: SDR family NAD(P)-dependent oxidoreductase [Sphingomonadales bacterium]|jgi:NAD(P)-dependent dehydrogenase (short-subunit alcohol dehydrogenase family)